MTLDRFLDTIFGIHDPTITASHMAARAVFVFFLAFGYVKIAGIRTFGKFSAFDNLTAIIMGAILARSIVSDQPFFPSLGAALVIVLLHRFISWATFKNHKLGAILKGRPLLLVKDGEVQMHNMSKERITEEDIKETMRRTTHCTRIDEIKEAYLERSGQISIIAKDKSNW
ncbi:MAG: DUF421 domain-containing protein [Sphingobacteriales bacterium JAD_PAG50586_3]|nr:MAG: DUF421 domain-containing protein [Sphingobacteriales bacterium JAD_PAG50586_3]